MTLTSWFTHNSLRRPRFVLVTHGTVQSPSRHKLSTLKIFSRVVNTVQWLATMTHDSSTGRLENNHPEYTTTEPFKRPAKWRHQQLCIRPVSLNYHTCNICGMIICTYDIVFMYNFTWSFHMLCTLSEVMNKRWTINQSINQSKYDITRPQWVQWIPWLNTLQYDLNHWGQVTHICLDSLTINVSDNGLSAGRWQAIIWTML